jgi:hypothetical protein
MENDPQPGGYVNAHTVPYVARQELTVENLLFVASPWGSPQLSGLRGHRNDGAPFLSLIEESPIIWMRVESSLPKKDVELIHLRRLATDCRGATGDELFDAIIEGGERPDFRVVLNGVESGWEMTHFGVEERRLAQDLFFQVTSRVLDLPNNRVKHLSALHIHMWFGAASDGAGLPYQRHRSEEYDQLVDALVAYRPERSQFRSTTDGAPTQLAQLPVRAVTDVQFYANLFLNAVPASAFFALTGTSLAFAFQTDHIVTDEWAKLRKAVARKDKPFNNVLVISAGAPDRFGRCFLAEEVLAEFLLEHPEQLKCQHLSSVMLHFWSTGRTFELLGDQPRQLWQAVFSGLVPAFHQVAPPPQVPVSNAQHHA